MTERFSNRTTATVIRISVSLQVPGDEPDVSVTTQLLYEPKLPWYLADEFHTRLYNGVHGGVASEGYPLPPGGVSVSILDLKIDPFPDDASRGQDVDRIGATLQALTTEAVAALWTGIVTIGHS